MTAPLASNSKNNQLKGAPSFPLRHRLLRVAWFFTWTLLAAWTPAPFRFWRVLILRAFGAKVHRTAQVHGTAKIWYPPNLAMDALAMIGPGVQCYSMAPIRIGSCAVISQRAHLCAGTHDPSDPYFQLLARPIHIGANSWICAEAFVGPGVSIGEGAILAARAAAFRDIPEWEIHRGNPASFYKARTRFTRQLSTD